MMRFDHTTLRQRVMFGSGLATEHVATALSDLGAQRVMVIASASSRVVAEEVTSAVEYRLMYTDVVQHVPIETATAARQAASEAETDAIVCVGGGSVIGLAKAIAMTARLPIIAVPTTYSGSEAANVWGITENSRKTTGSDDAVLPGTIVYDAELTRGLPGPMSVASGLNAIAHGVDAMWGPRTDPIAQTLALEGVRSLAAGLPLIAAEPTGLVGREQMLLGAYLSATGFAAAGSGLHHKICHVLGGTFGLPHAQTHAVVLPHVLAFNGSAVPEIESRLASAFGAETATAGLDMLRIQPGAPTALRDYGLAEDTIAEAVSLILPQIPAGNPRPVSADQLHTLIHAAWSGDAPRTREV